MWGYGAMVEISRGMMNIGDDKVILLRNILRLFSSWIVCRCNEGKIRGQSCAQPKANSSFGQCGGIQQAKRLWLTVVYSVDQVLA